MPAGSSFARFRRGNRRLVGIIVRVNFERVTADTALAVNLVKVEVDRIKRFFTAVFQRTTQRYDDRNSNRVLGRLDSVDNAASKQRTTAAAIANATVRRYGRNLARFTISCPVEEGVFAVIASLPLLGCRNQPLMTNWRLGPGQVNSFLS